MLKKSSSGFALLIGSSGLFWSCEDSTGPADLEPPGIQIISPSASAYDADGDGLIDVEIVFSDSTSGIDPASIGLTAGGRDLLASWSVTRRESTGLKVEETLEGLLPAAVSQLELRVSDRVGNERGASIPLNLPAAAVHRSIPLPNDPARRVHDVVMGPDGEVLFAVDESAELLVIDPNEYRVIAQRPGPIDDLQGVAFDTARNRVYAVSFLHAGLVEFDGTAGNFLRLIPTTQGAFELALSTQTSELYIPLEIEFEEMNGILSVVDRDAGEEIALIQSGIIDQDGDGSILGQRAALLTEDEDRLYVPTIGNGLLVYDPHGRRLVQQIDLLPFEGLGAAIAIERKGEDLYVGVFRHNLVGSAVYHLDARTGEILNIRDLGAEADVNTGIAASPDGTRLFVTGDSGSRNNQGAENYLLSIPTLEILAALEGSEGAPETFGYFGAAWHPDGKRIYVAAANFVGGRNEILVYLARPVR